MDATDREKLLVKFTIELDPRTKKNSPRIVPSGKKVFLVPSEAFIKYQKAAKHYMPRVDTIKEPINIKATFYMKTRRRVDLVNLLQALLDILVKYGVIEDDNSQIVVSMDGSRVAYDKESPRTEVEIWTV